MEIRVLHVVTYMGRGGLETMIMNYYRHMDRSKVQFDFLVHREFEADYDQEILSMGGRIYRLPNLNPFSRKYLHALDQFFKEHKEYKIVHCHLDCMAGIPLKVAKRNGVPVRIAHAHSSCQTKDKKYLLKLLFKRNIPKYSNKRFACGEEAGKWMYLGASYSILNNAIDTSEYIWNQDVCTEVRNELGIPEKAMVVGHVGRFAPPKNHEFIIDCFQEVLKLNKDAYLLLVGDGELRDKIQKKVSSDGLNRNVIFTGLRTDVNRLLQAMDVFLFPSTYEGLPVSIVEAQAAGLPCIISDKVPIECKKTSRVLQYSLDESAADWAKHIINAYEIEKSNTQQEIINSGFDICHNAKRLQYYYQKCYGKNKSLGESNESLNNKCMDNNILLTVFTPAYNRAHTLPRTYESLKKQNCKDFIWLIIDDGSSDGTENLVSEWIQDEKDFEIRYIKKENGGMHTAHNVAYENIDTLLNVCIDSDDCLAEGAVEAILKKWDEVKESNYAGIIGLDSDLDGNLIGKGFPSGLAETTLVGYYATGGFGDKKLVYRTDVINQYPPYPVFEGERYVALAYKYRLIDQDYKLAVLDKVLCNVEYQPDGSSGTMWKQYLKNPKGFAFWRKVCMQYPESRKRMVIDSIHYCSSSIISGNERFIAESPRQLLTLLVTPLGAALTIIIRIKAKRL